jgi:hypothetical protein
MRQGDPLPETAWNEKGDVVTLKAGNVTDLIGLKNDKDGRSVVSMSRNGGAVLGLKTAGK